MSNRASEKILHKKLFCWSRGEWKMSTRKAFISKDVPKVCGGLFSPLRSLFLMFPLFFSGQTLLFELAGYGTQVVRAEASGGEVQLSKGDGSRIAALKGFGVVVVDLRDACDGDVMQNFVEATLRDHKFVVVLDKGIYDDQVVEFEAAFKCETKPLPIAKKLSALVFDYAYEDIYLHPEQKKWTQGELAKDYEQQWRNVAHLHPKRLLVPLSGDCAFVSHAHKEGSFDHITCVEWSAVALKKIADRMGGQVPENVDLVESEFFEWASSYRGDKFDLVFDKDAFGFTAPQKRAEYCSTVSALVSEGGFVYLETKFKEEEKSRALGPREFFVFPPSRALNFHPSTFQLFTLPWIPFWRLGRTSGWCVNTVHSLRIIVKTKWSKWRTCCKRDAKFPFSKQTSFRKTAFSEIRSPWSASRTLTI